MKLLTAAAAARSLAEGKVSSVELTERAFARIDDRSGEGARVFIRTNRPSALVQAESSDRLRLHAIVPSPLAGVPISVKDLFDVGGEVTLAGSRIRADAPPAQSDALVIRRLRAAGAVIVGRTNMTEFAFSGIGINPHYGTPRNPWDRACDGGAGRIPGGSSSGAAVSVADGMSVVGLGTDTGGSVRIPAALCGLAGFKPTARRVPLDGTFPLSASLDSIGPIAPGVACCALVDAIVAGEKSWLSEAPDPRALRLGVLRDLVLEDLDREVAVAFESSVSRLSAAGAAVADVNFPELRELPGINRSGGLPAPEAYQVHREALRARGDAFDPRVRARLLRGAEMSGADYIELRAHRLRLVAAFERVMREFDAVLCPTVPVLAPAMAPLEHDDGLFLRTNALILRNPSLVNFLDGCALTVPCHSFGHGPVGLMIVGPALADRRVLNAGLAIERIVAPQGCD
ncbi:MAG: amidase [Betaproteobacteria bacterium]|nr:amidase [Betaproteobacteria bacterium]